MNDREQSYSRAARMPRHSSGTVLVIESETEMRTLACRLLLQAGFKVLSASTSDEALVLARHFGSTIDLLLACPADAQVAEHLATSQHAPHVLSTTKPFTRDTLLPCVQQAMSSAAPLA